MRPTAAAVGRRLPRGVFLSPRRPPVLWGASGKGAEDRPCSAGPRGGAGASSSRRWMASGRGCAVSGYFIGRCGTVAEGCFSGAPSVARTRRVGRTGTEERPCSAGARGGAGASSSRRWTVSGRGGAALGGFIGRGVSRCAGLTPTACAVAFMVRHFGRLHRPRGVEVCRTCVGGRGIDVHRAAGAGASVGVSLSQKRSRSNRSASVSSPPASARARAWSTS